MPTEPPLTVEHKLCLRRLAEQYDDPEGVTGPNNALDVSIEPLLPGKASAQHALDVLYGSVDPH